MKPIQRHVYLIASHHYRKPHLHTLPPLLKPDVYLDHVTYRSYGPCNDGHIVIHCCELFRFSQASLRQVLSNYQLFYKLHAFLKISERVCIFQEQFLFHSLHLSEDALVSICLLFFWAH